MNIIISFLAILWSILCLILFFKIWGMTNDVQDIKNLMTSHVFNPVQNMVLASEKGINDDVPLTQATYQNTLSRNIKEGDDVIEIKTGKKLKVQSVLSDGYVICYTNKTLGFIKKFSQKEIATLDEYNNR